MNDLVIRRGALVTPGGVRHADLAIEDGTITEVAADVAGVVSLMDNDSFRKHGHELVDWIADYFEHPERYPVLARVQPGEIAAALPDAAPDDPEPFADVMADVDRLLVPGLTHWNHPRFFAYFAITASPPGIS